MRSHPPDTHRAPRHFTAEATRGGWKVRSTLSGRTYGSAIPLQEVAEAYCNEASKILDSFIVGFTRRGRDRRASRDART